MPQKVCLPARYKTISVFCKCGELLVKYKKWGKWRLRKIHRDRITTDYTWKLSDNTSPVWTDVLCQSCSERIATIQIVSWKYVYKVNQGQLWIIRKS